MLDADKVRLLGSIAPANKAFPVTPSDSANFAAGVCDRLFVGTGGTVQVVLSNDDVCPYVCQSGQYLWVRAKRVNETSTTATDIVAEYL